MKLKTLKWMLAGGTVLVMSVLVGVYGVPIVQASTGPEVIGSVEGPVVLAHPGIGEGAIDMQALLADALGISVEELESAQQAAFEASIAVAVDEGKITQEQADQILERDGSFGRGFGRGGIRGELPEGFEPGEGYGPGRGRWNPFCPPDAPREDTSNTTSA